MSNRVYQHDEYIQNSSELGLPFGKSYQEYLLMSVLFFTFSLKGLTLIMLKFFHKKIMPKLAHTYMINCCTVFPKLTAKKFITT
jgi:hypothetical protein